MGNGVDHAPSHPTWGRRSSGIYPQTQLCGLKCASPDFPPAQLTVSVLWGRERVIRKTAKEVLARMPLDRASGNLGAKWVG